MARVAVADLWHESVTTVCMVASLVAIFAPLLLLLGLRHGAVEGLRERLRENPFYLEIRPTEAMKLPDEWFDKIGRREDVAWVLPNLLAGTSTVGIRAANEQRPVQLDLLPSAEGDPLFATFGLQPPGPWGVGLSRPAADRLQSSADVKIERGSEVDLVVTRRIEGRLQREELSLTVSDVLPDEAERRALAYTDLAVAEGVEVYREGRAVPSLGWAGGLANARPEYDGLLFFVPRPIPDVKLFQLAAGTGFTNFEAKTSAQVAEITGLPLASDWRAYEGRMTTSNTRQSNIDQVRDRLRGLRAVILPYVDPLTLKLGERQVQVRSLTLDKAGARVFATTPTPWSGQDLAVNLPGESEQEVSILYQSPTGNLGFDGRVISVAGLPTAIPLELAGILKTSNTRTVLWDPDHRAFTLGRLGYAGFRIYAKTLDDVPGLYRDLLKDGLSVSAEVQAIERIHALDRGLLTLFLVIAAVGVLGGSAALVASLYATVERKRYDLGVLRLIGLSKRSVWLFPVCQGAILGALGGIGALLTFQAFAFAINRLFEGQVESSGDLCVLPLLAYPLTFVVAVVGAVGSSLLAAHQATRIDPAEAVREE